MMVAGLGLAGCGDDDTGPGDGGRDGGGGDGGGCGTRTDCSGTCVDTRMDPLNCGACGTTCSVGETCSAGMCQTRLECMGNEEDCGGMCVDTSSSDDDCGRCGVACGAGEACMDGACEATTCEAGRERCGTSCADTQTDSANCGSCGTVCEAGEMCMAGACESQCESGQSSCEVVDEDGGTATICVDTMTTSAHCGACNMACTPGQACVGGTCACPSDTESCSDVCVNTDTDPVNCGSCGATCPVGQSCRDGACECPSGLSGCGTSCVNTQTDNANCGACSNACDTPDDTCVAGSCESACDPGRVTCGDDCVDLATSAMHCGVCDAACDAGDACLAGVCRPANDARTDAIAVALPASGAEATLVGSSDGATRDGPTISGCAANGPNVWYSVTLPTAGVLWVDTAGSDYDTAVFVTDDTGDAVISTGSTSENAGFCNDDCCGGEGDFGSLESCGGGALNAGTYFISVGGYIASSVGDFTLHVQFLPDTGFLYRSRLDGVGTTTNTVLVGMSEANGTCSSSLPVSGEDMRWFASCGTATETFSTCAEDGGSYTRRIGENNFDPIMYVHSGQTGMEVSCNDDGGAGLNCRGTDGDSANFGARLGDITVPRGINAVFVDSRGSAGSGMRYSMSYDVPSVP